MTPGSVTHTQMTAGLKLAAGASLHDLLGSNWQKRQRSYKARNAVIHDGSGATLAQAWESIELARLVIKAMEALPAESEEGQT